MTGGESEERRVRAVRDVLRKELGNRLRHLPLSRETREELAWDMARHTLQAARLPQGRVQWNVKLAVDRRLNDGKVREVVRETCCEVVWLIGRGLRVAGW